MQLEYAESINELQYKGGSDASWNNAVGMLGKRTGEWDTDRGWSQRSYSPGNERVIERGGNYM